MNNIKNPLLILAFLIVIPNFIYAKESNDETLNKQITQSYKALYNFNFTFSKEIIDSLKAKNKKTIDILILNINYKWWKIISNDTENNKKDFLVSLDRLKNNMQGFSEEKKNILLVYYYTYYCRYHLMYRNYFKVLVHYPKFERLIKKCKTKKTSHKEKIGLIKNFFLYLQYRHISLNSEKKNHYLKNIERIAESENPIVKTESNYLLMKIYAELEDSPRKAREHQFFLHKKYPDNWVFNSIF